jgi:hypothetical protein
MSNRLKAILGLVVLLLVMIASFVICGVYEAQRGTMAAFHFSTWAFVACALYCLWRENRTWYVLALLVSAAVRAAIYLLAVWDSVRVMMAIPAGSEHQLQSFELVTIPLIVISIGCLVVGTVGCVVKQFRSSSSI